MDALEIGKRIRELRKRRRMNQEELAELCDLSASLIGHIERGEKTLSLRTAVAMCRVFIISLDALVFGRADVVCDRESCPFYADLINLIIRYDCEKGREYILYEK
ncbi:MAG: helix-turn-helix transcriptional regulator [Clostridia bacterium]|nr:helix-turn-helix transcriptional regulator [Clostridia bacterium]